MKKVVIHKAGSYDQLKIEEFANPKPGKNEVLIETRGIGVNFADVGVRMGIYSSAKEFVGWPITPGFEVSGVVKELGEGVRDFHVGDQVIALTLFGGYTSHLVVNTDYAIPMPSDLSFVKAAAIPVIALTAYYGMFFLTHPRKGETILVHSAAGGVGSMLVQMGKIAGCKIVAVVGSSHKKEFPKQWGADLVIDKSTQNLWKEAEKFSPSGYDIIFDANGIETLQESYNHLSSGGKLVVYGFHTMLSKGRGTPFWPKIIWDYIRTPRFNPLTMTNTNKSVLAFNLSYLFGKKDIFIEALKQILGWFQTKQLVCPPITTYKLDDVKKAQQDLETGKTVGKLILTSGS